MTCTTLLFSLSVALILYTWTGYPALLFCASLFNRRKCIPAKPNIEPSFSVIIAVHNEEGRIAAKIEDCLRLEYPPSAVEILVASDGSTDDTEKRVGQLAATHPQIKLVTTAGRAGKSGAQNLAARHARGEILLFTDVETRTPSTLLRQVARHFDNPKVGLVAPVVCFGKLEDAVSQGQRAYWRFEVLLRQLESNLGILATASGQAFAVRRELFRPIPVQFGDDCIVPLDVRLQGFLIFQDPQAVVWDEMPHSVPGEFRARVRMTARNWGGILSRRRVLNPLRFPATAWGIISHKFLRWTTPFFLLIALLLNVISALHGRLAWALAVQLGFYAAAALGWLFSQDNSSGRIFGYPFAFCLANAGFFLGIIKSLRGQRIVAYK